MTRNHDRERDAAVRELVHSLVDAAPPAPPFPHSDARARAARGPRAAVAAFVVLALVAGAVAFIARQSSRDTRPTNTTHITAAPSPARSLEPIAYVGRAGLIVVDSPGHERVLVKGGVSKPTWSSDGKWLAFERPGQFNHMLNGRELWVVKAAGGAPRRLTVNIVEWSWSPSNPSALAAVISQRFGGPSASILFVNGSWRWEVPLSNITGVAWANNAATLAVATGSSSGPRLYLTELFDPRGRCLAPCPSKPVLVNYRLANPPSSYSLLLDRFTSDDRAVLGWVDEQRSGSIAYDGIALIAIPVAGGDATRFPTMLTKPAWVRDAPTGTDLLVVASNRRHVTDFRQVRRCDSAGLCLIPLVAGIQTMDPAWSPDGARIAYVRSDVPAPAHFAPGPSFLAWPARYAQRHLWVADAFGKRAHEVRGAGNGVAVLDWSDANHVIAVIDGRLRSVDVSTGRAVALTGALGQPGMNLPPAAAYEPIEWGPGGFTSWESLVAIQP